MRFYKNNQYGEEKNSRSFEIFINQKVSEIMEAVHEAID